MKKLYHQFRKIYAIESSTDKKNKFDENPVWLSSNYKSIF